MQTTTLGKETGGGFKWWRLVIDRKVKYYRKVKGNRREIFQLQAQPIATQDTVWKSLNDIIKHLRVLGVVGIFGDVCGGWILTGGRRRGCGRGRSTGRSKTRRGNGWNTGQMSLVLGNGRGGV